MSKNKKQYCKNCNRCVKKFCNNMNKCKHYKSWKSLTVLAILVLLTCTLFSQNNNNYIEYIEYIRGNIPVIITAPHGGAERDTSFAKRNCAVVECNSDLNTNEIAKAIYNKSPEGFKPHIILSNLHRSILDLNRSEEEAFEDNTAYGVYNYYHSLIANVIQEYVEDNEFHNNVLLIDLHGHSGGHILLGYNVPRYLINRKDTLEINRYLYSTVSRNEYSIYETILGDHSLGSYLDDYYPTFPSPKYNILETEFRYFDGGYTVERYPQYKNVVAIQLELPYYGVRQTKIQRGIFVDKFASILPTFYANLNCR